MELKDYFTKKIFEVLRSNHSDEEILDFTCYLFENGLCDRSYTCKDNSSCPEQVLCKKTKFCSYLFKIDFMLEIGPVLEGLQKIISNYGYANDGMFDDIESQNFKGYLKNFLKSIEVPQKYNSLLEDLLKFLK